MLVTNIGVNTTVANPSRGSILSRSQRKKLSIIERQSFVQRSFNDSDGTADTNEIYKLYRS